MNGAEERCEQRIRGGWWPAPRHVQAEAQGHLFRLKVPLAGSKGGGQRGSVCTFSARSRKRMLETLARIDLARAGFVCFVTLTYPDRSGAPSAGETERDRCTFLKRMRRGFPDASAVWRREWEPRDTGVFVGVRFPHYHLLYFALPFVHHADLNATWAGVLGWTEYLRTEIRGIESWRQALGYVAKYMAKAGARPAPGSPVGVGAGGPAEPDGGRAAPAGSLVYGTYLTGIDGFSLTGRAWGVFNRKRIPWGERWHVSLARGGWLQDAKVLAREQWDGIDERSPAGFTLFVDDPHSWLDAMWTLAEGDA